MQASRNTSEVKMVPPRKVPSRDERYMGLAFINAAFSKDPNTQHGAQIVTNDNEPLGAGYNGPPKEIDDADINWTREFKIKYSYINHAEFNAILHSDRDKLNGSIIYVTGKPCPACMLKIVTYGIKKVIYFEDSKHHDTESMCISDDMRITDDIAKKAGIVLQRFSGNLNWMRDRMEFLKNLGIFDAPSI